MSCTQFKNKPHRMICLPALKFCKRFWKTSNFHMLNKKNKMRQTNKFQYFLCSCLLILSSSFALFVIHSLFCNFDVVSKEKLQFVFREKFCERRHVFFFNESLKGFDEKKTSVSLSLMIVKSLNTHHIQTTPNKMATERTNPVVRWEI